jgi:hypothetical protein
MQSTEGSAAMSWAKFDDRYDDNRKLKRAWRHSRAAVGLHAMAVTYCCRHRTDGLVDIEWLEEKIPNERERTRTVSVLVEFELLHKVDDEHYRIHDFLDYNSSRQDREALSKAGQKAANARWTGGSGSDPHADEHADAQSEAHAQPNADRMRNPMPHPTTPHPYREEEEEEARERGQPTATAAVTAPPGLHPDHGEVVAILEAARIKRPGVVVDEASVNSALMAHRSADAVSAAHEVVSQLADGTARTDIASTVLRWVLRGQGEQRGGGQRKGTPRRGEASDVVSGRGSSSALARAMARDREQAEVRRRRAEQAEVGR